MLRFRKGMSLIVFAVLLPATARSQVAKHLPVTVASSTAKAHYTKALEAYARYDSPRSQDWARKALDADPHFGMALALLAELSPRSSHQSMLEKLAEAVPRVSEPEKRYLEAITLLLKNDRQAALVVLRDLHREFPDDPLVALKTTEVLMSQGSYKEAVEMLQATADVQPLSPRAHTIIAQCYLMQDRYHQARTHYRKAIAQFDRDATPFAPFFGLAWTYLYEGQPDSALAVQKDFLDRYNRNGAAQGFPPVWIWNQMARIKLEFGRPQEAYQDYETGYKSVPPSQLDSTQKQIWYGRMLHGKARSLAKMGRIQEAWQIAERMKQMLTEAGDQGERFWSAYYYLAGYIKLEAGEYEEAARLLEKTDLQDPFHKLLLARAVYKMGDKQRALKLYREITQYRGNNVERALSYPEARRMVAKLGSSN